MKHICELQDILGKYFDWNKSRLVIFANLLTGLFMVKTVNLSELATVLYSNALIASNYRRLQRFFSWLISINDYQCVIRKLVVTLLDLNNRKNDLTLDRTDWKFGKKHINILVLGVNFKGISVPLGWVSLGRAGNSKTTDRISILGQIIYEVPIHSFTADREFIGEEWFKFLLESKVPIFIRIKEDTLVVTQKRSYPIALRDLFKELKNGQRKILKERYTILGVELYIAASRNYKGELVIIVTNDRVDKALKMYKRRWAIETLFGYLKTKGFCFEATHMTNLRKVDAWMVLLTVAVAWVVRTNTSIQAKTSLATHGRKRKSIFRSCFEIIRRCFLHIEERLQELLHYISLLKTQKPLWSMHRIR